MEIHQQDLQRLFDYTRPHLCGLMARLIYASGIRLKEVVEIRVSDLDIEDLRITIRGSGDDLARTVYFPECLKAEIAECLTEKTGEDFLFSLRRSTTGEVLPVSRRTLQIFLTNSSERLKMSKITAETLRMLYALHLLKRGVDPRRLKETMGFKNFQPILRFVKRIPDREIRIASPLNETVPVHAETPGKFAEDQIAIRAS